MIFSKNKQYIGDAVYAEIRRGELIVTTEDGMRTTNTIIFEPLILDSLCRFAGYKLTTPEPEA